jgi:hypothetical protein
MGGLDKFIQPVGAGLASDLVAAINRRTKPAPPHQPIDRSKFIWCRSIWELLVKTGGFCSELAGYDRHLLAKPAPTSPLTLDP